VVPSRDPRLRQPAGCRVSRQPSVCSFYVSPYGFNALGGCRVRPLPRRDHGYPVCVLSVQIERLVAAFSERRTSRVEASIRTRRGSHHRHHLRVGGAFVMTRKIGKDRVGSRDHWRSESSARPNREPGMVYPPTTPERPPRIDCRVDSCRSGGARHRPRRGRGPSGPGLLAGAITADTLAT
jgi:hypothetical protein